MTGFGKQPPGPTSRLLGRRVGHIRVVEPLGRGGMGDVYVGFDETLQRRVALKVIGARHRLSARSKARFLREARILSRLEHPGICGIYDYVEGDDGDFLVLELIEGSTLSRALANGLDPAGRLNVAVRIAEVLEAAHGHGVVHRDLKPDNVMVTPQGEIKVLDFGLARTEDVEVAAPAEATSVEESPSEPPSAVQPSDSTLDLLADSASGTEIISISEEADKLNTRLGQVVGTPIYMSPEQANGAAVTTASDIYSFGLLLQALFSGRRPYPDGLDSRAILARARRSETLPVTGLDSDLTALINRMKSPAPAARPTAVTALDRLRWIRDKPKRRLKRLVAAAVLVTIALAAGKYTLDLRTARDEANRRRVQAESLIGFMIGDLRAKLAPVNRLEVLEEIGDRALEYFGAVPAADLSESELLFRSRTLSQIGQVRLDQGDLTAAKEVFDEALALAEDLVGRDPKRTEWKVWLGSAHFWAGEAVRRQNDLDGAQASFAEYLRLSRELVDLDPDNLEWQLELAYAQTNMGSVLEARGQKEAAIAAFRRSLAIKQRLVAGRPGNKKWRRDLAASHSWLGGALLARGHLDEALEHYRANWKILEPLLAKDPGDNRLRWRLGIAHEKLGKALQLAGAVHEAGAEFEEYEAINLELVAIDPENSTWRRELAMSRIRLGQSALAVADAGEASDRLRSAKLILLDLMELERATWIGRRIWR